MRKLNRIAAFCYVSESELALVIPDFNKTLEESNPDYFYRVLYDLGIDTDRVVERQDGLWHRNRFNKVTLCS
jgi:hypothetical protein